MANQVGTYVRGNARSGLTLVACCIGALVVAAPASAGTLDQQQLVDEADAPIGGEAAQGQTFTAGLSGALDQVDLPLRLGSPDVCDPFDVTVEIRNSSGGLAIDPVLATETVASSELPAHDSNGVFVSVVFADPVEVVAGTQYAIVLVAPDAEPLDLESSCAAVGHKAGNPYAGGTRLFRNAGSGPLAADPNRDLAFRTYVLVPASPASCRGRVATIVGTVGSDTLVGTPGPDVIATRGGKDTVRGLAGRDRICGGKGNDVLRGNVGSDRLFGGAGFDKCRGGGGRDRARGCEVERTI